MGVLSCSMLVQIYSRPMKQSLKKTETKSDQVVSKLKQRIVRILGHDGISE